MLDLIIITGWTFIVGFTGYSIASAARAARIRELIYDRNNLRRWCDQLAQANTELDLELELERIRK